MATKSAATKIVAAKSKVVRPGTATPQKEADTPEKDGAETPDGPLPVLDLSDAAVKKMIKQAKKRGYVTYEQLNGRRGREPRRAGRGGERIRRARRGHAQDAGQIRNPRAC